MSLYNCFPCHFFVYGCKIRAGTLWTMFKIDKFSQGITDLSFNQFTSHIEPMLSHTIDANFEEEDVLNELSRLHMHLIMRMLITSILSLWPNYLVICLEILFNLIISTIYGDTK